MTLLIFQIPSPFQKLRCHDQTLLQWLIMRDEFWVSFLSFFLLQNVRFPNKSFFQTQLLKLHWLDESPWELAEAPLSGLGYKKKIQIKINRFWLHWSEWTQNLIFFKIIIKNYIILIHYNQPDQQATYALSWV